jgi:hypothetical protein
MEAAKIDYSELQSRDGTRIQVFKVLFALYCAGYFLERKISI